MTSSMHLKYTTNMHGVDLLKVVYSTEDRNYPWTRNGAMCWEDHPAG
jgi:hypothetical protein